MPKQDSRGDANPYEATIQENANTGASTNQENTATGNLSNQENPIADDASNEVDQSNSDNTNRGPKNLGDGKIVSRTEENAESLGTATRESNPMLNRIPAPSSYGIPYPTVYDPTGHYARGKSNRTPDHLLPLG